MMNRTNFHKLMRKNLIQSSEVCKRTLSYKRTTLKSQILGRLGPQQSFPQSAIIDKIHQAYKIQVKI